MMRRLSLLIAALAALTIVPTAQIDDAKALRSGYPLTILQINDVYSTIPTDGVGGLARVAAFKQRVIAEGRTPILMMAGDFLSSSVASTVFKGEQMIATLNSAGLDIATLGNHEFDFGVDVLLQRMREARWQWVVSNILDTQTNQPIGGASPTLIRTFGSLRVGFIGLCVTTAGVGRPGASRLRVQDPLEAAGPHLQTLKKAGVDVVVALTHLTFAEDRALADRYPEIDVIVGGHEHYPITAVHNRTLISKAGTEARFVARIDINRRNGGPLERFYELIPMNAAISEDPATAAVAKSYEDRMGAELEIPIARTRVALDGITARLRTSETNLGNLVADAIRTEASADVAIVNAGGIRGDRLHAPGPLTRRLLLEIHPFGNVVCKIAVPGRVILNALNHGVAELPLASGQFPQVSGLTMRVDMTAVPGSRVSDVRIVGQPLDLNRIYTVALPDYLLLGGDSYKLFAGQRVLIAAEDGTRVTTALESYVMARGEIAPAVERRIIIEP